jgi:thioesterase domain-containing protein
VPPEAAERIARFAEDWLRSTGREVPAFSLPAVDETEDLLRALVELARRAELLPPDLGWDYVYDLYRSFESNLLALTSYEPAPWEGSAVLFRATGTPEADRSARWEALTRGGLRVRTIAGDHYSILRPPQVSELARALGETLAGRDHS